MGHHGCRPIKYAGRLARKKPGVSIEMVRNVAWPAGDLTSAEDALQTDSALLLAMDGAGSSAHGRDADFDASPSTRKNTPAEPPPADYTKTKPNKGRTTQIDPTLGIKAFS